MLEDGFITRDHPPPVARLRHSTRCRLLIPGGRQRTRSIPCQRAPQNREPCSFVDVLKPMLVTPSFLDVSRLIDVAPLQGVVQSGLVPGVETLG
jgi:hypothetical protein